MGVIIGALLNGILFGCLTRYLAKNKGYEGGFAWGFFLGLIGLIVVAARRNIEPKQTTTADFKPNYGSPSVAVVRNGASFQCPVCKVWNEHDATKCKSCDARFI